VLVAFVAIRAWYAVRGWINRRVYDFGAAIRRVRGPFVLVLRSFADGMAYVDLQWARPSDGDVVTSPEVLPSDVFGGLLAACGREMFFGIGKGRRLENLFLLNMPDKDWFEAFTILARHAKAILILPEDTGSLLKEVGHVVREHAAKVTLLMPPSRPGVREHTTDSTFVYIRHEIERGPRWEAARSAFDSVGIKLPAYDPLGAFLRVALDGELTAAPLPWSGGNLARLLHDSQPYGDAQAALRELRRAGIPLVSIPGDDRPSVRVTSNLTPPIPSGEPFEDVGPSPYQAEKRRQRAALREMLERLSPAASPAAHSERTPPGDQDFP
jgi:hypothetical protein